MQRRVQRRQPHASAEHLRSLTRRTLLSSIGAGAVGAAVGAGGHRLATDENQTSRTPTPADPAATIPFYGQHQAGITTPPQRHLCFASFDFLGSRPDELRTLLIEWTRVAASLTQARPLRGSEGPDDPPSDPGETAGLAAGALTLTFGFSADLFERDGKDRIGLLRAKPNALIGLPSFRGEALDPRRSGGDLCVQACAEHPQVAFHAIHALTRAASPLATPKWTQSGFRADVTSARPRQSRNLFGFKDGAANIATDDTRDLNRHVWVAANDDPAWLTGGSYLVVRRIQMLFDVWDPTSLQGQEQVIGRRKASGALIHTKRDSDEPDLSRLPRDAHIRLAAPASNDGHKLLRRSYSFDNGIDPATGQLDAGLLFACFQRDPRAQFVPIQRRLADSDALNRHTQHTGSGLFACLPGPTQGGFLGETLFTNL